VSYARDTEPSVETRDGGFTGALDSRPADGPAAGVYNYATNSRLLGTQNPGSEKKLARKDEMLGHETFPLGTHHSSSQKPVS
jgi:hypothetical protein